MSYKFNPHAHVKVWLSNNPDVFMNFVNQTRLIDMREKNPNDVINLVYDSSLLTLKANAELLTFCYENNFTPVDADSFKDTLNPLESALYGFYKDEVTHLKEGGNLGVASDILRWLSSLYRIGTYTDLDVPLDTSRFPDEVKLETPLLLNIGSLRLLGNKEMVLVLNELIGVADEKQAKPDIERVQAYIVEKLRNYSSNFVETTEKELGTGSYLNRTMLGQMKNRAETLYIVKANELIDGAKQHYSKDEITSRELRGYVTHIFRDNDSYLNFKRVGLETNKDIIQKLRNECQSQLGFIKWLFFRSEYQQISRMLELNDEKFVTALLKKEKSLYIKSIVVCTTGPIAVMDAYFGKCVLSSSEIDQKAKHVAFSSYGLDKAFLSRNVVPLHQDPVSMLRYMGADVGELNDSSWLEEGMSLQARKQKALLEEKRVFEAYLPDALTMLHQNITSKITQLKEQDDELFAFIFRKRRHAKIDALTQVANCFDQTDGLNFDIAAFRRCVAKVDPRAYDGVFSRETETLIKQIESLCHKAIVFRSTDESKILHSSNVQNPKKEPSSKVGTVDVEPMHTKLFQIQTIEKETRKLSDILGCGL